MAKKITRKPAIVTPSVPVVVPVTTPAPMVVGTPSPNATGTTPPVSGNNLLSAEQVAFVSSVAKDKANGITGQARLGREIGRWSAQGEMTEDKMKAIVVAFTIQTAIARDLPDPTGTPAVDPSGESLKGTVSRCRTCMKVGALPNIGRAAIDTCYEYAVKQEGDKTFLALGAAAAIQRDKPKTLLTVEQLAKAIADKKPAPPSEMEQRVNALRAIRSAIDAALNEGVTDAAKMKPAQTEACQKTLADFRDGRLAQELEALGAGGTAEADKAAKALEAKRASLLKAEAEFAARMNKVQ